VESIMVAFRTGGPAFTYAIEADREAKRAYAYVRTHLVFICSWVSLGLGALVRWFFFTSRRRHTRLQGDWSSDVCSSDLSTWRSTPRTSKARWKDRLTWATARSSARSRCSAAVSTRNRPSWTTRSPRRSTRRPSKPSSSKDRKSVV